MTTSMLRTILGIYFCCKTSAGRENLIASRVLTMSELTISRFHCTFRTSCSLSTDKCTSEEWRGALGWGIGPRRADQNLVGQWGFQALAWPAADTSRFVTTTRRAANRLSPLCRILLQGNALRCERNRSLYVFSHP